MLTCFLPLFFGSLSTLLAQRGERQPPQLISQKTNRPLEVKRQPAFHLKLANKKDASKVIDLSIEQVNTGKLEILYEWVNFTDKEFKVTVKNNGALPSNAAYLAINIGAYFGPLVNLGKTLSPETVYSDGQVISSLKAGETKEIVFDITKAYALLWGKSMTKKMDSPYGYAVLITEPIVIK